MSISQSPEPVNILSLMARDLVDVIKFKVLRWEDHPGLMK